MAVYTDVTDEDLAAFLADYDLGEPLSLAGIAEGIENSNFHLLTERGSFILTLYEKRVQPSDLPFFLSLMSGLADQGQPCPRPVPRLDGQTLSQLNGRPAAVISFLPGLWPRRATPEHCGEVGQALAALHGAAGDLGLHRENDLSLSGWHRLAADLGVGADLIRPGLQADIASWLDRLEARWPRDLPTGVIHADLFPDNVFFRGSKLSGVIDFYFACTDLLAYDIAICLNAWCFEPDNSFNITKARRLLSGYQKIRPLEPAEMDALPLLATGAALRFLLTRAYDWINTPEDAFVTPKDPLEYLTKVQFHQAAQGPGAYGLDRPD